MPNAVAKLVGIAAAALAAMAARQLVSGVWRVSTGHAAPKDPESPEHRWGEAIAFAAITGALVGAARVAVTRAARSRGPVASKTR